MVHTLMKVVYSTVLVGHIRLKTYQKGLHMANIQKEISLREKYSNDIMMSRLLKCNASIGCINYTLKRYGSSDLTLEEIGLVLGVTRERVRQIEASALKKLKHPRIGRIFRNYCFS